MLMSLIAAMALAAANPAKDACRDDGGKNRCSEETQHKMRVAYRVQPISAYGNAQVRRVFFVDGNGRDRVVLEFIRAAERSPLLRVHFSSAIGETDIPPIEKELTSSQWEDVISLSRDFDKTFVGAKSRDPDVIVMCIHPWVYWVEAIDPGNKARSKVGDACDDSPMETFVWPAAKLARSIFPHCDILDRSLGRNDAILLRTCAGFTGDKIAAARAFNVARGFRFLDDKEGGNLKDVSDYDITLEFNGQKASRQEARGAWDKHFADGGTTFNYYSVHGLDAKTVRVTGELWRRYNLDDENDDQVADVEMIWAEDGSVFEVKSIKLGAFRLFKMAK